MIINHDVAFKKVINMVENIEDAFVTNLETMIEFAKEGIVSKTFLDTPDLKMVLFCMAKGQSLSEHTASMPASIHVMRGKAMIILGENKYEALPGTWIYMPAELKHAINALEDFVFLLTLHKSIKKSTNK
ncbi:MAG: cupin domain-containing protein [Methanomassiliicoccales archaeon]|jgi:quercetin dioxygenase-like cupin family protein